MKTPEEILDEIAAENMINIQQMVTTKQLAVLAMRRYAKLYHDSEVKKLNIPDVIKSLSQHECKYCGAMTTKPDEQCYKAPNNLNIEL